MSKRILIFSPAYWPLVGGAEVAVKEITGRLPDWEFVMLTAKLDQNLADMEKIGNIEVRRLGKGNNLDKYRLIGQGWKKALELGKFDAVWSIMASYAGFATLRYKKRNPGVPFLLTLQEGDSRRHIYRHVWWCWPYFKQIFKKADRIQAISQYLADWARELGAKCPTEVVPNGVDANKFSIFNFQFSINDQISNIKNTLGITTGDKVVITVSRLVKKNGVADLIRAINILNIKYQISNIKLLIAGEGGQKDELLKLVKKLNLNSRVHFLGNISHDDLPKYLRASDVFCRPSLSEGLGNAFLEAMAAGVPIVGTPVGGIPDFLLDGETGLFCKVADPRDIAEKVRRILDNPALSARLKINGRKLAEEKYSWDAIAQRMEGLFKILFISAESPLGF